MQNKSESKVKSLKEEAYDRIYLDIITLKLKPGQYLSESFLQKKYNISKAPARIVLVQLEHEKLLQNMGRKGHMIRPVTIQDIRNVFQLRIFLEPPAAKLAAGSVDTEKLAELDAIFSAAIKDHSSGKKSFLEVHTANRDFHLEIAKAIGNNQLVDMLKKIVEIDIRIHHLMATSSPDLKHWNWDHKEIIDALVNKDGATAEKKIREHIEESHAKVMFYIMNLPSIANTNISD